MKIVHIVLCLLGGGIQNFLLHLSKEQVKSKNKVWIISIQEISDPYEERMISTLENAGVSVIILNKKIHNKKSLIETLYKCRKEIFRIKPDIVNTHGELSHIYGALATKISKTKHVITIHNAPENWGKLNNLLNKKKTLIFCSNAAYELRQQKNTDYHIIPNGISHENYTTNSFPNLRKQFNLGKNDKIIVLVGSLRPQKNYQFLLDICDSLKDPSFHFFICGGHYGNGYIDPNIFKESKNIHLLGLRSDIKEIENEADLFMSCATYEGLPIAVLEAYFNGIPCLLSPIVQHKQIADVPYVYIPKDFSADSFCETLTNIETPKDHQEIVETRYPYIKRFLISETENRYRDVYISTLK